MEDKWAKPGEETIFEYRGYTAIIAYYEFDRIFWGRYEIEKGLTALFNGETLEAAKVSGLSRTI